MTQGPARRTSRPDRQGPGGAEAPRRNVASWVTAVYLAVAIPWIALSDQALLYLVDDAQVLARLQTWKGWFFVAVTALLLHVAIRRMNGHLESSNSALTEREAGYHRLSRIQRLITGIHSAMLRTRDPRTMLDEVCRLAVESGGFRAAWIELTHPEAVADPEEPHRVAASGSVDPEALPRPESDDVDRLRIEIAREGELTAWVPIHYGDKAIGVLGLQAERDDAFDTDEGRALLRVLGDDVAIGYFHVQQADHLAFLSLYDPLTRLPNQRSLIERLDRLQERARSLNEYVGVVVIKVTNLRRLGGVYGRWIVDHAVQVVARTLRERLPNRFAAAGRLDSGRLCLLLPDYRDMDTLKRDIPRMLDPVPVPLDAEDSVTVRLIGGAAIAPDGAADGDTVLRNAGIALRSDAPAEDGNCRFYSAEIDAAAGRSVVVETELARAVSQNELWLAFQPIVDLSTRQWIGFESLVRWESPRLGSVSPAEFIPVAERSGLIDGIGAWVFSEALQTIRAWRDSGAAESGLRVSVNLSARQLTQPGIVQAMRDQLNEPGQSDVADGLAVEVTETAVLADLDAAADTLRRLRAHGVRIYLDDFGTGYSSLHHLHRLPVDVVKIDRSFVSLIDEDREAAEMVDAIAALAQRFDLDVVAEGVETDAHVESLRAAGCRWGQGFLFSRPVAADRALEVLASRYGPMRGRA